MNHLGVLLTWLLLLVLAAPSLTADTNARSDAALVAGTESSADNLDTSSVGTTVPAAGIASKAQNNTSSSTRPTSKERSRRPARIDLTMPYYRFGRLPIRVKD